MLRFLRIFSIAFVISLISFSLFLYSYMNSPVFFERGEKAVVIERGETLSQVLKKLGDLGIVKRPWLLESYMVVTGLGRSIKAGEYRFYSGVTPIEVVDKLVYGKIVLHRVTVREGDTVLDIGRELVKSGILRDSSEFVKLCYSDRLVYLVGIEGPKNLEGYLFPDTYLFERGTPEDAIVRVMITRFREKVLTKGFFRGCKAIGLTPHQVITLASMVEKETYLKGEKPIIAAVFLNRLRKGMKLQCDPTVRYATGNWRRKILKNELRFPSPYNTYYVKGLPPGPICSPGLDSIWAVIHPAKVDYLYFVAGRDGRHHFSYTLEEHVRNKRIFGLR